MTYRLNFVTLFIHGFPLFLIFVFIDDGLNIDYKSFLFSSGFVALFTYAIALYFKITITDKTLAAYDVWGRRLSVEWREISEIKTVAILGLRYAIVLNAASKRTLWVPLFLSDLRGFRTEIVKRLDDQHLFRAYFEDNV